MTTNEVQDSIAKIADEMDGYYINASCLDDVTLDLRDWVQRLRSFAAPAGEPVFVIFDGPPAHESGRFVEVETKDGKGLGPAQIGADWKQRPDGLWALGPLYAGPQHITEAQAREAWDKWTETMVFEPADRDLGDSMVALSAKTWLAALRHFKIITGEGP